MCFVWVKYADLVSLVTGAGNVTAQIEYTKHSSRWKYPSSWYSFEKDLGDNKTIEIVMIDTVILSGQSDVRDEYGDIVEELDGHRLQGPDAHMLGPAQEHLQWLEQTLKNSTAAFLVVAGHYPVWSICEHGPTAYMVKTIKPMLEQYHVTAYIAGHDHCIESFVDNGIDHHGMGASHENNPSTAHKKAVPAGLLKYHSEGKSGGFGSFTVNSTAFVARQHDGDGTLLYTAPTRSPRNLTPTPPPPSPAPPAPPTPPAPGQSWECHDKTMIDTSKVSWLSDDDLKSVAGNNIEGCEAACNGKVGCVALYWHKKDNHCHVLSGPAPTHDQFMAALQKDSTHETCILTTTSHF